MSQIGNNPSGGLVDGGGAKPLNLSKDEVLAIALNDYKSNLPETFTKVQCNDGTVQSVGSNSLGGRVDVPCKNNGGVAIAVKPTNANVELQNRLASKNSNTLTAEDKFYESLGIKKTDGSGWGLQSRPMGRLLVSVVLVAGYFAYKKFKK